MDIIIKFHQLSVFMPIQHNPVTYTSPCFLGVWATKLGKMAGVNVPLVAMHHAYVVTERIEGIQVSY